MTTPTIGAAELPEALRSIQRYKIGYATDDWGMSSSTPGAIRDASGAWVRYSDHAAQVEALSAAQAGVPSDAQILAVAASSGLGEFVSRTSKYELGNQLLAFGRNLLAAAPQPSPSPAPAQPDHVQNSPENEHIADDLSKNGRESNMTDQPGREGECDYPPLPTRRRAFLCTKCGERECEPGTIHQDHPPCKCGYQGFAEDLDFNAEEMRAYVDADRAARAAAHQPSPSPAPAEEFQQFTTGDDALNDLLNETFSMARGPNTHDTAMLWLEALQDVKARLQPAPAPADEGISREQWVEQAVRVYLIAGDTENQALECAKALCREQNWDPLQDDLADPYDAAMSDVEERGPAPQPATADAVDALPDEKTCVDYVLQYGGRCRDCADENGVCPGSGLPCGSQRKAVTHVVQALRYGLQHGYLSAAQREVKP